MSERELREPHAVLDETSRVLKATKIVAQISGQESLAGAAVLDVGCGNGVIARELARAVGPEGTVTGIDLVDQRKVFEGYSFLLTSGTSLPFPDETFDVVVSNHCIEHVGNPKDQLVHLREIRRVLTRGGLGYLALPSRWTLVEPHFGLPLLSWLPKRLSGGYVRLARRGSSYDCDIPSDGLLRRLMREAGLEASEITVDSLRLIREIERPGGVKGLLLRTPSAVATRLRPLMPTRTYLLRRTS